MSFGDPSGAMGWTVPEAEALPVLKRAYDLGINTWDTVISPSTLKSWFKMLTMAMYRPMSIPTASQNAL
jgi:hypothetical protein